MDRTIRADDVIVCRVNGTSEFYVIGTVLSGKVGELLLRAVSTLVGQEAALRRAYEERMHHGRVWLFDGAAAAYVDTVAPPARGAVHTLVSGLC
jgi:hypothetical protein